MSSRLIALILLVLTLAPTGLAVEVSSPDRQHPEIRAVAGVIGGDLLLPRGGDHRNGAFERIDDRLDGVAPPGLLTASTLSSGTSFYVDLPSLPDAPTCRPWAERLPYYATAPPPSL